MLRRIHSVIIVLLNLMLIFLFEGDKAFGANFPEKPINAIVGFSAGAGIDAETRALVPYIQKHLGVHILIENIPGASGKMGLTKGWKAKPDGYTLNFHTTTTSLIGEVLFNPEYRIIDFSHIFSWARTNQVLVVNSEAYKTLDEFINVARKRPLPAGLPGRGTGSHLIGLIFADALKIKVNWVHFDGSGECLASLAGKHIDFALVGPSAALSLVRAGKLRALLILAESKDSVFPDLPLAKELGYDFPVISVIRAIDGPPKMPMTVIKVIEEAAAKAVKDPNYLTWAQNRMLDIVPLNHEEYRREIEKQLKEIEKYKFLLKG